MSYEANKKWRKKYPYKWRAMKQRYYEQFAAGAYNRYSEWTLREIELVLNKVFPDRVIAEKIGRTVKAIQMKRTRLQEGLNYESN